MATITDTRQAIADALSLVPGLSVRTRAVKAPKQNDGWVIVRRVEPATYTACDVTFSAVVILGPDDAAAQDRLDALSVPLVNAVTTGDLHTAAVSIEPLQLLVGDVTPAPLYALVLTLTLECE